MSFSGTGLFGPAVHGPASVVARITGALGLLTSYRYMLTPHSALEVNYSFIQNNQRYIVGNAYRYPIRSREQEITGAYIFGMTFKRYNPFVEVGVGSLIFTPVLDNETTELGTKSTKGLTHGLFGGGLAYELEVRASTSAPSTGAFW